MNEDLKSLLNCDRENLLDLILKLELKKGDEHDKLILLYARVITAYYDSDIKLLDKYIKKLDELKTTSKLHELVYEITKVRRSIRLLDLNENSLSLLKLMTFDFPEWKGEINFVCGFAYGRLGNHYLSKECFLDSYQGFQDIGIERKSLIALQNYISSDIHLNPGKKCVAEYESILRRAERIGAEDVQGLICINLSNQYEEIGAINMALIYARKAIDLLYKHKQTYQHARAISHLCRLLFENKYYEEGNKYFEQLKAYSNPEIIENIELLDKLRIDVNSLNSNTTANLPWWLSDFKTIKKRYKLGKLGEELVLFLSTGPKEKDEIITHLYGDKISYTNLENRFYVLLNRFKKTHHELIVVNSSGKYTLKPISAEYLKKVG